MKNKLKILLILIILVLSIGIVSASDDNSTDGSLLLSDDTTDSGDLLQDGPDKEIPVVSVNSSNAHYGESIDIYLKDKNDAPITNQNLTTTIDNISNTQLTDLEGKISLKLNFKPDNYLLNVYFRGNENFSSINQTFNIGVLKANAEIIPVGTTVVKGDYFHIYLKTLNGTAITSEEVSFSVNGKTYTAKTNGEGKTGFKANLAAEKYSISVAFRGNDYFNPASVIAEVTVVEPATITIGNTRLLSNGYLRIYLKCNNPNLISKKTVKITVGSKTFTKTSNSEGIIVFKPNAGVGTFKVTVTFNGDSDMGAAYAEKTVTGIKGDVKNPLKQKIPLKNGLPDVDLMPGSYVLADEDMTYTLTKAQYRDVIKRDSYCLYLNNKLSKYTFFKSKSEPKLNHIIKREKWNVIERAVNTKIVKKNKKGYWPSKITVSLKGKSYTYSEVRDEQNTGYTCGPTSASMCTQVLRNYFNEKYMAQLAGTSSYSGSSTRGLKKALEKKNFKCSMYYKKSFNKALKQLKKGGCTLVFHTWNHYVAILDISKDGKKVLVGNPSGDYDHGSHAIPTNWLTVKYMKKRFNNYDTSGLIVKLNYNLKKATKNKINYFYSSFGTKWVRQNTGERIPQIGY